MIWIFPLRINEGTFYQLTIEDEQKFQAFGQSYLKDEFRFNIFKDLANRFHSLNKIGSVTENQLKLLNVLSILDSGLELYQGSLTNMAQWANVSLDENRDMLIINCED